MLIEKWKEGWTPKWSTLQIEYSESLDVDYCVNEPNAEIKPTEQHDADAELLISWYRIRAEEQIHDFELYETRCHIIRRSDECILTFSTKFENYGRMKIVSKSDEVSHDRVYSKYFI
ncbi:hypothetical protein GCK72_017663 [Caenorhabditis remanei]|uniref:F-box associated domain-containing protein n=1 Tax=Caenorhabditis remanei TaxID=31234 RepID=A0A6A5G9C2_CAERE|nr:hypothetical protein GCK72_017663 [Caenorhabditis remanei]KAF1751109.1 hypothetical protein GCK72_017663 [Caenorhabditis remanei]